ncbi:MAG: polysaccharide deacetylase family protein, partial [bacterium]
NHPDTSASYSCSECGKRICYNCRIEAFGHAYCSLQCASVFVVKGVAKTAVQAFSTLIHVLLWPLRQIKKSSLSNWMEIWLGLCLLACFIFIYRLNRNINSLSEKIELSRGSVAVLDTSRIPPPKIVQPTEGGMVFSNMLDIVGASEENRMITLSIDGELKQVVLPQNGQFVFEGVKLNRGDNRLEIRAITEQGSVSTLQTLSLNYASPMLTYLAKDFRRGPANKKDIALTFDGGSIDNAAAEILDILKEKGVKSTFFLTGEFIRRYLSVVRRISSEGHEVGNHTWSHPHLTTFTENGKQNTRAGITAQSIETELSKTASLFRMATGQEMISLWRAPFGEYNGEILRWAAQAGYMHVRWTVGQGREETMDTLDWVADKNSKAYYTAEEIAQKILKFAGESDSGANGAIILFHLGTNRTDDFPHKKLPDIIDGLYKKGFKLVKVSEMMPEG